MYRVIGEACRVPCDHIGRLKKERVCLELIFHRLHWRSSHGMFRLTQ